MRKLEKTRKPITQDIVIEPEVLPEANTISSINRTRILDRKRGSKPGDGFARSSGSACNGRTGIPSITACTILAYNPFRPKCINHQGKSP